MGLSVLSQVWRIGAGCGKVAVAVNVVVRLTRIVELGGIRH